MRRCCSTPLWPYVGQANSNLSKMQKLLDAEESQEAFGGCRSASRRSCSRPILSIYRPICMPNWDERRDGLWDRGASLGLIPNEMNGEGEGRDRIVICEDDEGDGTG